MRLRLHRRTVGTGAGRRPDENVPPAQSPLRRRSPKGQASRGGAAVVTRCGMRPRPRRSSSSSSSSPTNADALAHVHLLLFLLVVAVATTIPSSASFQMLPLASPTRGRPVAPRRVDGSGRTSSAAPLGSHFNRRFGEEFVESNGDPANGGGDNEDEYDGVHDMARVRRSLEHLYNYDGGHDGGGTAARRDEMATNGHRGDCANANDEDDGKDILSTATTSEESSTDEEPPTEPVVQLAGAAQLYRSQLEIMLLESLEESDEAVDELVHLWVHETTPHNAHVLEEMSQECSPGMQVEQEWLRRTIEKHPGWVEPQIRLATLLFYKGETQQSHQWAVRAYEKMPYHFEIVPLLVMICLRQSNVGEAIRWARQGLPTLRGTEASQRRRSAWVQMATEFVRRRQQRQQEVLQADMRNNKKKIQDQQQSVIDSSSSWQ